MKSSVRLFRIAGIDIGVHYTWIFIFLLITWSLAQGYFPQSYPSWSTGQNWFAGVLAALFLFVSVLIHELAHSLVARARGMQVDSITLFLFGGVSNLHEEPEAPKTEFLMAIVGPLSSFILAGIFYVISRGVNAQSLTGALVGYLSLINLILAIFNLLPGFPLDGGRVLRSIIWASTGSLSKATNVAAIAGRLFGWALIIYGLVQLLTGNFLGGLWIAFIGWFLNNAADANRREIGLRERLSGVRVRDVTGAEPVTVAPETSVDEVITSILQRKMDRAAPVCRDGKLLGIITVTDIRSLSRDKWAETPVEQVMTRGPLYTVSPEDSLDKVLQMLSEHDINQVIVENGEQCAGILKRSDIIEYLRLNQELGLRKR